MLINYQNQEIAIIMEILNYDILNIINIHLNSQYIMLKLQFSLSTHYSSIPKHRTRILKQLPKIII